MPARPVSINAIRWAKAIAMKPAISVIICSLNGAEGVDRCLRALNTQTIRPVLQLIVVDDGSSDSTSDVGRSHGVSVVRHDTCRGLSAARNSGLRVASAPIVAFLDDDCEPEPDWAENLALGMPQNVLALGGALTVRALPGFVEGYLSRINPLDPQELDLRTSPKISYRFWLYLRRQWSGAHKTGRREVYSIAGGNMALWRDMVLAVGGFDERIRFGGDDDDMFLRLKLAFPGRPVIYDPSIRVTHYFRPSLRDTLRRSRAYGRGQALMYRKWPAVRPTFFPFPLVVFMIVVLTLPFPYLAAAVALVPQLLYPRGMRAAIGERNARCFLDPYIQLAQETWANLGFVEGLLRTRGFPAVQPTGLPAGRSGTG